MAITYPRTLPDTGIVESTFELLDNVTNSGSNRGHVINRSRVMDPTWTVNISTRPLDDADWAIWNAWKKSLQGGLKFFAIYDVKRSTPLNYPDAEAPTDIDAGWNGLADLTVIGVGGDLSVMTLTALPANYQFKAGDRIGLEQSGRFGYYEVIEDVNVGGDGAGNVTVMPFIHSEIFTVAAVARIWRPRCQFAIDWKSWDTQGVKGLSPVSFMGVQSI